MTLGFDWATNDDYSAGPDTGTPTKVDPLSEPNGFIRGFVAAPQHVNFLFHGLGQELAKAVDGIGGGSYTLGAPLQFGGQAVRFAGPVEVLASGELNVKASSELNVEANGVLTIAPNGSLSVGGLLTIGAGANLVIAGDGDIHLLSNADLDVGDGARLTVAATGTARVANADRLMIDAAPFTAQVAMVPVWQPPSGWSFIATGVSSGTMGWLMTTALGEPIIFWLPVRPGDTLLSVTIRLEGDAGGGGGHSAKPADMPVLQVLRKNANGAFTLVAQAVDDSETDDDYDAAHDLTLSFGPGHSTFNEVYYVRILAEGGAGADANSTVVYSMTFTGLARSFRSSVEVYG